MQAPSDTWLASLAAALAGAIEAADICRKGGKDVADRGDIVLGGAHDSRKRAGDSTRLAAGDGAVKRHAAGNLGGLGDVARQLGGGSW